MCLLTLQWGYYSQGRCLIDTAEPEHVTVSIGPCLAISFLLYPICLGYLSPEEVHYAVLGAEGILEARGLRTDSRLHGHLIHYVGY